MSDEGCKQLLIIFHLQIIFTIIVVPGIKENNFQNDIAKAVGDKIIV